MSEERTTMLYCPRKANHWVVFFLVNMANFARIKILFLRNKLHDQSVSLQSKLPHLPPSNLAYLCLKSRPIFTCLDTSSGINRCPFTQRSLTDAAKIQALKTLTHNCNNSRNKGLGPKSFSYQETFGLPATT